jgi:hypothetical protein
VWRFYRTDPDADAGAMTCVEEGFFYPDELPETNPDGWHQLQRYVEEATADVARASAPDCRCSRGRGG